MIFTMNSNSLELNLEASLAIPKLPSPIILVKLYLQCKVKHRLVPGKHGRGARGAAPASDVARCGDARGTPLPARPAASCHVFFFFFFVFFSQLVPTQLRLGPIRTESGRLEPYQEKPTNSKMVDSGRN